MGLSVGPVKGVAQSSIFGVNHPNVSLKGYCSLNCSAWKSNHLSRNCEIRVTMNIAGVKQDVISFSASESVDGATRHAHST